MNISVIKIKDVIINNIHFRILYENEIKYEKKIKPQYFTSDNFVDNLFNYSYNKKNNIISKIKEPYAIIYDLIEPIKLKYSLIKSNKNYVLNGQNITSEEINDDNNILEKKIYFIESNYFSYFISWCHSLSKNSYNIKTYSDLKINMKKFGINSLLRFFALMEIDNNEINNIIKI